MYYLIRVNSNLYPTILDSHRHKFELLKNFEEYKLTATRIGAIIIYEDEETFRLKYQGQDFLFVIIKHENNI